MDGSISEAQADMREGYYSGAAGIMASAIAWSAAAGVALAGEPERSIVVLLLGGMLIHPISVLICKALGSRGSHTKGNPLGQLAGASTFWLIFCLPLAYGLGQQRPAWFFSAMLVVIGGRYLVFATLYGMRLYWVLGFALVAAAILLSWLSAAAPIAASAGAAIEMGFALVCFVQHRQSLRRTG
ncbi:hypothetical protein [Herpetosiphon gulosus]|uniref:Uncharacterized protein n=1 Tax=Herpetosiphon gulosus TaxID=1973496 RepID=A0ABP9X124_9CHLR